ncbi:MAG: glycosyltransferase family 4 protein [Acidobacteriia bacterium]|nr:glycosyltransferase family 4 protein [Terriglobia bacterium]
MKILLVHNSYLEQGGEDVVFWQERSLLKAAGHEVLEYQRHNTEMEQYSMVRRLTIIGRTVWASDSYREFTNLLRDNKPDVVHVHNTFPLISPSILWACRRERVPVVHTLHNYRLLCPGANFIRDGKPCEDCVHGSIWQSVAHGCYRDSRPQTAAVALMLSVHRARRTWTEAVDRYIVLTSFARSRFVNAGLPAEKITVKGNCVDPDPGQRTGEGSYALFVGRVSREKGTPTLLQAWRQLPRSYTLRIVGDGPARQRLESEAAAHGLNNVSFLGRVSRERVIEAMKGARFVVFPSQLYENLPLTIVEAFACGVPVVASKLGAMAEIVEEGRTGLFFEPGNPDDLARAVKFGWEQPELMRRLGTQARSEYETKYTAAANYRQLMEIYQQVIAKRLPDAKELCVEDLQEVPSA